MGKIIVILLLAVTFTGCGSTVRVKTEVQETFVPIMHCPAPPETTRPDLPIHQMTPAQKQQAGEIVKHYKATIKELQGYSQELERIIEQYREGSQAYDELKNELYDKLKQDGISVPQQ